MKIQLVNVNQVKLFSLKKLLEATKIILCKRGVIKLFKYFLFLKVMKQI